jgi:hypothetical protein
MSGVLAKAAEIAARCERGAQTDADLKPASSELLRHSAQLPRGRSHCRRNDAVVM